MARPPPEEGRVTFIRRKGQPALQREMANAHLVKVLLPNHHEKKNGQLPTGKGTIIRSRVQKKQSYHHNYHHDPCGLALPSFPSWGWESALAVGVGPSGWGWPILLGVAVALPSRGWGFVPPFLGCTLASLLVAVALPSWCGGWPNLFGVGVDTSLSGWGLARPSRSVGCPFLLRVGVGRPHTVNVEPPEKAGPTPTPPLQEGRPTVTFLSPKNRKEGQNPHSRKRTFMMTIILILLPT